MLNNETYGISAEVAFCDVYNIQVNQKYRERANENIVNNIINVVKTFKQENKDFIVNKHIAEKQNVHDFIVNNTETLSLKSIKKSNSQPVAPQIVGQPTPKTYYKYFYKFIPLDENSYNQLDYQLQSSICKKVFLENIEEMLTIYWKNMNSSDHFIMITNAASEKPEVNKIDIHNIPQWGKYTITTTRNINNWNESNTIKLNGTSIAEFQIHKNRKCFKFRFKLKGLRELGLIS